MEPRRQKPSWIRNASFTTNSDKNNMKDEIQTTTTNRAAEADETNSDVGAIEAVEQLKTENVRLKATIRLSQAHRQITAELAKAGARSPELLFTSVQGDVQFGDDGTVQNTGALVSMLKAKFPEQFGSTAPGSIDAGLKPATSPLTASALAKMSSDEIARLDWDDVKRVLTS